MASWVRGKCIGKGVFGVVNLAVSKRDGRAFAVKSVDRKTGLPSQLEALENEIRILQRVSSPHVVTYLGDDVTCEEGSTSSFRNLHLEYMPGGTVADLDFPDVDERLVRRYAWCLVNALRDVHACGVVHCDVKGRNVLLAGDGSVAKLADFGAAMEVSDCTTGMLPRGSPMWMAPEVIRREYQGPESDVWSLGCTVIEMVTRKPAWEDRGVDTLSRIGYSDELPEFPSKLSELGRDFLEKCLNREPSARWSCDQLLQHPFLLPVPNKIVESSPRCILDWVDSQFTESENDSEEEEEEMILNYENSVKNRISKLATESRANWETEGWVVVREIASNAEPTETWRGEGGVGWEFENVVRVEEEIEEGTCSEYSEFVTVRNERVKREIVGRKRLEWRRESEECNRNRNRRKSVIIAGGGCDWSCRYGWQNKNSDNNCKNITGIFSIYYLRCKLFNSYYYLLSIYFNILCFLIINVPYRLLHATKKRSTSQGRKIIKNKKINNWNGVLNREPQGMTENKAAIQR